MKIYKPLLIKATFLRKAYFDPGSICCQDLLDKTGRKTGPANEEWGSGVYVAEMLIIVSSLIGLNNLGKYLVKWIQSESKLWPTEFSIFYQKKKYSAS